MYIFKVKISFFFVNFPFQEESVDLNSPYVCRLHRFRRRYTPAERIDVDDIECKQTRDRCTRQETLRVFFFSIYSFPPLSSSSAQTSSTTTDGNILFTAVRGSTTTKETDAIRPNRITRDVRPLYERKIS